MKLSEAFPKTEIDAIVDNVNWIESEDYADIFRRNPVTVHGMWLALWDILASSGIVEPFGIAAHVENYGSDLRSFIEGKIGRDPLNEIYYAKGRVTSKGRTKVVSEVLLARIYPNELYLADVEFRNPRQPIRKQNRKYRLTKFRGLGLLPVLCDRMEIVACDRKIDNLRLTAATGQHVGLFAKQGYSVADTAAARLAPLLDQSFPMVRAVPW